eukprot:m.81101 g.81101  ORF g.81101 m.81101 type:complete len:314 (+) comp17529_c0_seq8:3-944(+)
MALVALCGLPAAGKSLLCRQLQSLPGAHVVVVAFDEYLEPFGSKRALVAQADTPKAQRAALLAHIEALVHNPRQGEALLGIQCSACAGKPWSEETHLLLLDDTNYYRSMRHAVFQLARKYGLGYCQIFLTCPLEVALGRNEQRAENKVAEASIRSISAKLEAPHPQLFSWERFTYSFDTSAWEAAAQAQEAVLRNLHSMALLAAEHPPAPVVDRSEDKARARENTARSLLHALDLATRRTLSDFLATLPRADQKIFGQECNQIRRDHLTAAREQLSLLEEADSVQDIDSNCPFVQQCVEQLMKQFRQAYAQRQ